MLTLADVSATIEIAIDNVRRGVVLWLE